MTASLLVSQFAYKAWANAELLQALAQIDVDAYPAQRQRAIRLLNHTYVVDRIFAAHLDGGTHAFTDSNTPQTPALEALRAAVAESDRWYAGYVAPLDTVALQQSLAFRFTDGDAGRMTREEMRCHVLAHGAYHRGNIGMLLSECAVEPPRELFTRFLHARDPERRGAAPG
ncbi:damage-inducible protein DinB [Xanthomonas translucens pv. undulosa]|uniref:DinB family protein n=1 Tax=Xanthomonas campestris pv. translucens TaxID=343 RepID=UPI00071E8209|nr:DinB family protein [Xanthomonas translucens]QEO26949.1 damage-inducible protein DinB [Xanthomonas translucens pv. undulosa]QSQ43307.1 damage-inducible protein DinB [Xanthomonas translucens pv. translucens]QSQ48840.1 damage-inducible protein DinB [Xanthomonas translucens pv. undulosa]UJB13878.1 damage-inducible protein DinB [Xanthomonas translucens pv. undulosa]WKZ99765.1 damage-inducible protein DinB [Xanthomonas translucens]